MTDLIGRRKRRRRQYKTGEDIEMLREKNSSFNSKKDSLTICDKHIDGA